MGWWPCSDCCGGGDSCSTNCINTIEFAVTGYTLADTTSAVMDDNINWGTAYAPAFNAGVHVNGTAITLTNVSHTGATAPCVRGSVLMPNSAAGSTTEPGNICDALWSSTTDCNGDVIARAGNDPPKNSVWQFYVHPTDGVYVDAYLYPVYYETVVADYVGVGYPTLPPQCRYIYGIYSYLIPYTAGVQYSDLLSGTALPFSNLGGYGSISSREEYSCSTDPKKYPIYDLTGSITLNEQYLAYPDIWCDDFVNPGEYWSDMTGHNATNTSCNELWGRETKSGSLYTVTLYRDPGRASADAVCGWSGPLVSPSSVITLNQLNASGMTVKCDWYTNLSSDGTYDYNFRILT